MREHPRLGSELAGYRLDSVIARGGMAVVYLAEDLRLNRRVAVKILAAELAEDETFRERFLRESRIAASIDHPNVIPIHDAGEADGLLYIAMRHVEDTDLRGLLRAEGRLGIDRAIALVVQVAAALEAAHKRGLVHRDVKPANVLLIQRSSPRAPDHAYLSDFGLAKRTTSVSGLTATGQFLGTVSYVAPEQALGKPVDARTDIYALGCVLFECLAGSPPFRKDEDVAVVMAHINDPAPAVTELRADCPPRLAAVVAKALAKSPDDRFQGCGELIDALRVAAPDGDVPVTRTAATPADQSLGRQLPGGLGARIAAAIAIAAVAIAAVLLAGGGDDGEPQSTPVVGPAPDTRTGSPPDTAGWRALREAPTSRQQAAAWVDAGRIWVIGGLTGTQAATATDTVEVYDPAIDNWTAGPALPVRLHHATAVAHGDDLLVIGGWIPRGADLTATTSNRVFALREGSWEEIEGLNHARAGAAAAVVGDQVVVVGGQDDEGLVAPTEVFDGQSWQDAAPIPTPREHLAAATDGEYLYAVGGRELSADKNTGALERYDPREDRWTKLPSMPTPTGGFGAAIVDGSLVAVGGEDPTDVIGAVQGFDLETQKWSSLPAMRTPRHGHSVVAIGSTLYALDGALTPGHGGSTNVAEALDFR